MAALSLAVGVSVFIFGMLLMKYALENSFREKLGVILEKFTSNRFSSVFTGAFVTMAMQSSSASSVLTAAFVDSGILSLYRAFWIIVGANVGTTFTGLLTAFSFTETAPAFCIPGIILLSMSKKRKLNSIGIFLTGFGLLFVGMALMGEATGEIKNYDFFTEILISCSSPVMGILTGCLFTAVIQSSSAVTALLQTLGNDGILGIRQAFYIILGSNIGTCATCSIASMGLKAGAKKVSLMHILYNFFGAVIFLVIAEFFPLPEIVENYFPGNIKTQIAAVNIVFNISTAVFALVLPIREKQTQVRHIVFSKRASVIVK